MLGCLSNLLTAFFIGSLYSLALLDWRQPDPIKSMLLLIIGWLVGW